MDVEHIVIAKMFEGKMNFLLKRSVERQPTKKKMTVSGGSIFKFFFVKDSFKRKDVPQKESI